MKLSEFELEVIQHLWQLKESTAPELHKFIKKERDVTYSTVKTIIDRLEEKKAIKRIKTYGKTIVYAPLIKRESLRSSLINDFMQRVMGGQSRPLLSHLFENESLSKEDVEYLEQLLAEKKEQISRQS